MISIRPVEKNEYEDIYRHMKRDFPANEVPPYWAVWRALKRGVYSAFYMEDEDIMAAYAIVTAPQGSRFALINYLAVLPEKRSSGYGGKFLSMLKESFAGRVLVVEVDARLKTVDKAEKETRIRRIKFYERHSFRLLPSLSVIIFGVDMEIMVNTQEDVGSVRDMMHELYIDALKYSFLLKNIKIEKLE